MDIRSLRYFIEAARLGSFTQAAHKLGVTQSTISKMVRQLEDELGETLLLRDTRPPQLTDTGQVVYRRGQEILAALRQLETEIHQTQAVENGRLAVGIPPMINLLFTDVIKVYRERYPKIELELHEGTGQAIEIKISRGELEVGTSILPIDPTLDIAATEVLSHSVWAVGSPIHIPEGKQTITLRSLAKLPLIFLNDDFALTRRLRHAFFRSDLNPNVIGHTSQWDWTLEMAATGMGVALLPEPFIRRTNLSDLSAARVVEPTIDWPVAHLWNGRYLSHAAQAWVGICKEVIGGDWPT